MPGIECFVCGLSSTCRGIHYRWHFLLTVAFFIILSPSTVSAMIVNGPLSHVALVGSKVRMECITDGSSQAVNWEFAPADSDDFSFIYTDRQIPTSLASRYKIDRYGETQYDIYIDSVDPSHAGTYICTPVNQGASSQTSASAQLIVLESNPVCESNTSDSNGDLTKGVYYRMWCTLKYTGNLIPVMDWNSTIQSRHITTTSEKTEMTSLITMKLSSADDGLVFACLTSFNPPNSKVVRTLRRGETAADNVPDYAVMWEFTFRVWLYSTPQNEMTFGLALKIIGGVLVLIGASISAVSFAINAYKKARNGNQSSEHQEHELVPQVVVDGDRSDGVKVESTKILKSTE